MSITPLPPPPNRATDSPQDFTNKADAFLNALPQFGDEVNTLGGNINNWATQAEAAKNVAGDSKTQSQQYAQQASQSATDAESAKLAAEAAKQATLDAASSVGALDLLAAKTAVMRQKTQFFNLNLL